MSFAARASHAFTTHTTRFFQYSISSAIISLSYKCMIIYYLHDHLLSTNPSPLLKKHDLAPAFATRSKLLLTIINRSLGSDSRLLLVFAQTASLAIPTDCRHTTVDYEAVGILPVALSPHGGSVSGAQIEGHGRVLVEGSVDFDEALSISTCSITLEIEEYEGSDEAHVGVDVPWFPLSGPANGNRAAAGCLAAWSKSQRRRSLCTLKGTCSS
jgi:hypothetical protein